MAFVVVNLFVALLNLLIGFFALIQSKKKKSAFVFLLIVICATLWSFFISTIELTNSLDAKVMFARLSFFGPNFLPLLLIYFTKLFPNEIELFKSKDKENLLITSLGIFTFITQSISLFTSGLISSAEYIDGSVKYIYGVLYLPYFLFFAGSIILMLYFLFSKYRNSDGVDKLKLKFILLGFSISAAFAITTNLIFPLLGNDEISKLGPVSTIFLFVFTSYSVISHRLFDIGTFLVKILEPVVIGTILYLIVFIVRTFEIQVLKIDFYNTLNIFIDYVACIVVAIIISWILRFTGKFLSKVLANNSIEVTNILGILEENLSSVLDVQTAIDNFTRVSKEYFPDARFYFCKIEQEKIIESNTGQLIDINIDWIREIKQHRRTYITQENSDNVSIELQHRKISVVGILSNDYFIIFLDKEGNHIYTKLELDSIELVVEKLSSAWERIRLHQQTEDFNKILENKVSEQTKELTDKNATLEENLRKERDMMDILGHELRTPLSIARNQIGAIELYLKSNTSASLEREKIEPYIGKSMENMRREVKILETILSSTKIENNRIELNITDVDCIDVVNDAVEGLQESAKAKNLELRSELPSTSITCKGDREKVQEIIFNLVDNAIKYTEKGSVIVKLEVINQEVKFSVIDTGEGIPAEDIPKLGKKFFRSNMYLESHIPGKMPVVRPGGTGIGLFVVFGLAKLMGGRIEIISELNVGSTFSFILPINQISK